MHSNFAIVFRETTNTVSERIALRSVPYRAPFILRSTSVHPPFDLRSGSGKQKDKRRMSEQESTEQGRTINFLSTFKFTKQWQD